MARWDYTVTIGRRFNDEAIPFTDRRNHTVKVFRDALGGLPEPELLGTLLDELAETETVGDFDAVWSMVYDWGDEHRVWIDTFASRP